MNSTERFLAAVRRRLRVGWIASALQSALPVLTGAALVIVLIGWIAPWSWPEPTALGVVVVGCAAVLLVAPFVRISVPMAARAADRSLGVKDAFTAALQFPDNARFGDEIVARAERFATDATPRQAVPITSHPKRLAIAFALGALAVVLALVANPRDDDRARTEQNQAVLDAEAATLQDTAESIRDLADPTDAELAIANELDLLAEELLQAQDLTQAEQLLRDRGAALAPDASQLFSTKAAVQGLNRSLEAQPLPGAAGDAADQLDQVGEQLDELSAEDAEALAERLDALAATQGAGNPDAAAALSSAAAALRAGDTAGARAALGEASGAQRAGEGQLREGQVGQAASAAAGAAADRTGQGQGQGQGQGSGEGEGEGQGSGQGSGQGQGQGGGGQGSGGGGGGGNPSGNVGGGATGGQNAAGQGGQGQAAGGGNSTEVGTESDTATIFDPGGSSEELFGGGSGEGESETVGLGQGPTNAGSSQVPLADILPEYERRAVAASSDPSVPPSQRDLVQRYFEQLAGLG